MRASIIGAAVLQWAEREMATEEEMDRHGWWPNPTGLTLDEYVGQALWEVGL